MEGIVGDFDKGLERIRQAPGQRCLLLLGSTLFLGSRPDTNGTLQLFPDILRSPDDFGLIGQDCHTEEDRVKIEAAYHTSEFGAFINSFAETLSHARGHSGLLKVDKCGLRLSEGYVTHYYVLQATKSISEDNFSIDEGTSLEVFHSHKPGLGFLKQVFARAGLQLEKTFEKPNSKSCTCYVLTL